MTKERAESIYGVVLADGKEVDYSATVARRASMRKGISTAG
jgi:hypothetical protein